MSYYIRLKDNTTLPVDKACPFIYEGVSLFSWYQKKDSQFQVVEATTGTLISAATTEEEAIKLAKTVINEIGIDKIKAQIFKVQKLLNVDIPKGMENIVIF